MHKTAWDKAYIASGRIEVGVLGGGGGGGTNTARIPFSGINPAKMDVGELLQVVPTKLGG